MSAETSDMAPTNFEQLEKAAGSAGNETAGFDKGLLSSARRLLVV